MKPITTPEQLLIEICAFFNADINKIVSHRRFRHLVKIRHYYNYIGNIYYKFSLDNLGAAVGHRDHTTVIHSRDTIIDQLEVQDVITFNDIEALKLHLELHIQDAMDYEQLEAEYNGLMRDYLQLKALNKRLKREKVELTNKNITLRQEIKRLKPVNCFGEPILITPLTH